MDPHQNHHGSLLDAAARDELATRHLDLVAKVVGRLPIARPHGLDRDDLLAAGTVGLLTAARTFQPGRGAAFPTFAYLAIKSAVLDEMRRHDPLPRGARAKLRELERFESELRAREGRLPLPDEIATGLGIDREAADDLVRLAKETRILGRDELRDEDGDVRSFDPLDERGSEPSENAQRSELLERVEEAIAGLSPRERQVFVLYHSENLYLKAIGEMLGVSESRICQILACAEKKVKAKALRERRPA
jgi:RNA polymerase sigma factor for flagellar operon FliA